jgi:TonB family protein
LWNDLDELQRKDWFREMSARLQQEMPEEQLRADFLRVVHVEALRAGLNPGLVLALISTVSHFRKYAVGEQGARGYMQVSPAWISLIGTSDQNLFHVRTNLRYGCTILRRYLDDEKGDYSRSLARYERQIRGALTEREGAKWDTTDFPARVLGALESRFEFPARPKSPRAPTKAPEFDPFADGFVKSHPDPHSAASAAVLPSSSNAHYSEQTTRDIPQASQASTTAASEARLKPAQTRDDGIRRIREKIAAHMTMPSTAVPPGTSVNIRISLFPTGLLDRIVVLESSGIPAFDKAITRAILASQPLPIPQNVGLASEFESLTLKFVERGYPDASRLSLQ